MAAAMTLEAETSDALAVQRTLPDDALRIAASGEAYPSVLNSIVSDAAGGFVSVLIGCVTSLPFSCAAFRPLVLLSDAAKAT